MVILAADTSAPAGSVAVSDTSGTVHSRPLDPGRTHSETLLPAVAAVLEAAALTRERVQALAVGIGPGAFTGLRVGLATFQGWAAAAGLPIAPVPSLDALALPGLTAGNKVLVLTDARKGELYAGFYTDLSVHGMPRCRKGPDLLKIDQVRLWCQDIDISGAIAIGSGVPPGPGPVVPVPGLRTGTASGRGLAAESVLRIGRAMIQRGQSVPAEELRPFYLRPPDAVLPGKGVIAPGAGPPGPDRGGDRGQGGENPV